MLPESYDPLLVALSFIVATFGSFVALSMAERLVSLDGRLRPKWIVGAAFAQGTGIWGMHFTGMLALRLPVPIAYDAVLVAASWIVAFTGSLLAVGLTHRRKLSPAMLVAGGLAIGAGIAGLHFIDMAAMTLKADPQYRTGYVVVSIVVAVIFGLFSLWSSRDFAHENPGGRMLGQPWAATIMGVAIVGQHYTAMAAADFHSATSAISAVGPTFPSTALPGAVLVATFAILTAGLAGANADRAGRIRAMISRRLLIAQENERRRIARVLHEDLGQLLTAIRLNLQRLSADDRDNRILEESTTLVDDAIARVRTLALELRPSVLDDLGLAAAIAWFGNRTGERAGFDVTIKESLGPSRLPEMIETASFRIVWQVLTNIARHAKARQVSITMVRDALHLDIDIVDDGVGFDVDAARASAHAGESLGLLDMNELATLAGGELSITSAVGRGTHVHLRFELPT